MNIYIYRFNLLDMIQTSMVPLICTAVGPVVFPLGHICTRPTPSIDVQHMQPN